MGIEVMAMAGIAGSLLSTGLSVYSGLQQAKTAEAAGEYNKKVAETEAKNTEMQAREQGYRQQIQKRKAMANLRNGLAGQGVMTTSGTPLAILGESASNMQLSIDDAYRGSMMEAASVRSQGAMSLWSAQQQATASRIGAVATGIKGISSAYSQYASDKQQGIF